MNNEEREAYNKFYYKNQMKNHVTSKNIIKDELKKDSNVIQFQPRVITNNYENGYNDNDGTED